MLHKEFQEDRCFYCGKKLEERIHVDHFIPWIFVKNDNLWNFVLACPRCNLHKSDKLASYDFVVKIEKRNEDILKNINNQVIENEFNGYCNGLIERMWTYAKMSGIRENKKEASN